MTENSPKLTPKQESAALSLAMGGRIAEAAETAGVKPRTVKAWLASVPSFKRRIKELRSEMTSRCLGVLADNAVNAANTLAYLSGKAKSERLRVSASVKVIELLLRTRELVELGFAPK